MTLKTDMIEEAITEWFGARCKEKQEGCPICDAWAQYDVLKDKKPTPKEAAEVLWKEFNSSDSKTDFKPAWNAWKYVTWTCDGSIYQAMSAWLKKVAEGETK